MITTPQNTAEKSAPILLSSFFGKQTGLGESANKIKRLNPKFLAFNPFYDKKT
jgi:hypothetical protein